MISSVATGLTDSDRGVKRRFGDARWALPTVVILLLAGIGLWRGANEDSFRVERTIDLRPGLTPDEKMTAFVDKRDLPKAFRMYAELTGRELIPSHASLSQRLDRRLYGRLVRWGLVKAAPVPDNGICYHRDGRFSAIEIKQELEDLFQSAGLRAVPAGRDYYRLESRSPAGNTKD